MVIRITKLITFVFGVVVLLALTYIHAQYNTTPDNVAFTQNTNQTFLPAGQCIDGGRQVYGQYRLYQGDRTRPYDYHVKGNTTRYIDWFRFDAGKTNIELKNGTNNIFDVQGPFVIQSYGNPRNQGEVVLWTRNVAGMVVQNIPSSPTQIGAQLIYRLHRDGIDTQNNGNVSLPSFWYYPSLNVANPLESTLGNNQYMQYVGINNKNVAGSVSGVECSNFYISRCGDGYLDSPGSSTRPGYINHAVPLPNRSLANEFCDPGNPSQGIAAVIPAGQPAGTTCSTTCQLVPPANPPALTIDKQQRLVGTTVWQGVGLNTPSIITYTSPAQFEFNIIITNNGGNATNVVMRDTVPAGFVMAALPGGCSGTLSNGTSVVCNAQAGQSVTSQPFNLAAGQIATFVIRGTLTSTVPTVNSVYASYTNPVNGASLNTPTDSVNQNPIIAPVINYTKTVRNVTTNSNAGQFVEADTQGAGVIVNPNDLVQYQITINRTGGPVVNTLLSDILPNNGGFIMTGYSINNGAIVAATSFPQTNITTQLNAGSIIVTLYGSVGPSPTASAFVNTANLIENGLPAATLLPGSNVAWTRLPDFIPNSLLRLEKYWIDPSNPTLTGDNYTVSPNTSIKFILRVRNTGNVSAIGVVADTCPSNLFCQTYRILPSTTSIGYPTNNTINVGSVPVGGYVDVEISATAFTDTTSTSLTNIAQLYINSVSPANFMNADDASLTTTRINDFEITKTVLSGTFISGAVITYRIEFKNTGNTAITSYRIVDILPSVLQYLPGTARLNNTITVNPSITSNQLIWGCADGSYTVLNGQTVCPLQPNTSGVITFDARVIN